MPEKTTKRKARIILTITPAIETYSEICQISEMGCFAKEAYRFKPLTTFAKHTILNVWKSSEYASILLPCYWTIATTAVWFSYYSDWVNAVVWTKDIQKFTTKHKIVCKEGRIPYFPLVLARIIENHNSVKRAVFIRTLRKTFNDKKSRKLRKTEKLRCEVNINPGRIHKLNKAD